MSKLRSDKPAPLLGPDRIRYLVLALGLAAFVQLVTWAVILFEYAQTLDRFFYSDLSDEAINMSMRIIVVAVLQLGFAYLILRNKLSGLVLQSILVATIIIMQPWSAVIETLKLQLIESQAAYDAINRVIDVSTISSPALTALTASALLLLWVNHFKRPAL